MRTHWQPWVAVVVADVARLVAGYVDMVSGLVAQLWAVVLLLV
ncbi:hypothetical protein ACH9DO_06950 [Kocuria sp. M1N1S27]